MRQVFFPTSGIVVSSMTLALSMGRVIADAERHTMEGTRSHIAGIAEMVVTSEEPSA